MRGIRIGVLYDLKDKLSGGLGRIKERMGKVNQLQKAARLRTKEYFGSFSEGIKNAMPSLDAFKNRNIQLFDAISERVPFLSNLGAMLSNPFVLAAAAVAALIAATIKLGGYMVDVTREISENQAMVQKYFKMTGDELADTTAHLMAISDILNVDNNDLGKATNTLTKEFEDMGATAQDSLKIIQDGLVATNGALDLENIKEYATRMNSVGLSMDQFMALMVKSEQEGVFNDKMLDTIKEFDLRVKELPSSAKDALTGLGLSSDSIMKSLNDGSKQSIDIMREVTQAMKGASVQARQTAVADLFGGPGEDLGERVLLMFGEWDLSMKSVNSELSEAQKHMQNQIALQTKLRKQQSRFKEIIQPIVNLWDEMKIKVMTLFNTVLADAMKWYSEQWEKLEPIMMLIWKALKANILPVVILIVAAFKTMAQVMSLVYSAIRGVYNVIKMLFEYLGKMIDWVYNKLGGEGSLIDKMFEGIDKWGHKIKIFFEDIAILSERTGKLIEAGLEFDTDKIKEAYRDLKAFSFRNADALYQSTKQAATADGALNTNVFNPTTDPPDSTSSNASIAANSTAQRNITVNIQNLNEGGINLTTQNIRESANDVESAFIEMLIRAIRNVEQTI